MTPGLLAHIKHNIVDHEGRVLSLYGDTNKPPVPTVGVGHALFSVNEALRLVWHHIDNRLANHFEIQTAWNEVQAGKPANKILLEFDMTERLLEADLAKFEAVLIQEFPELFAYPDTVVIAMFDIAFNCGSLKGFPHMSAAIKDKNWVVAADESNRPAVSKVRNKDTWNQLFRSANVV